jgi:outer membrane lipoprotein SlyB
VKEALSFTQKDIIEKDKSVVGRAIIGTALLGPLGGVVGGISGIGKKGKATQFEFLAIHYTDKDGKDETAVFKTDKKFITSPFIKKVNAQIGSSPSMNQSYEI